MLDSCREFRVVYFYSQGLAVFIMVWTSVHRSFIMRAYYENNSSVIATQRAFRLHFCIPSTKSVPSANSIKCWSRQLDETVCTLSRCGHGAPRTIRTPENMLLVGEAVKKSPRHALPGSTLMFWKSLFFL